MSTTDIVNSGVKSADRRQKVTEEDVIQEWLDSGASQTELAKELGVSQPRVSQIINNFKDEVCRLWESGLTKKGIQRGVNVEISIGKIEARAATVPFP